MLLVARRPNIEVVARTEFEAAYAFVDCGGCNSAMHFAAFFLDPRALQVIMSAVGEGWRTLVAGRNSEDKTPREVAEEAYLALMSEDGNELETDEALSALEALEHVRELDGHLQAAKSRQEAEAALERERRDAAAAEARARSAAETAARTAALAADCAASSPSVFVVSPRQPTTLRLSSSASSGRASP